MFFEESPFSPRLLQRMYDSRMRKGDIFENGPITLIIFTIFAIPYVILEIWSGRWFLDYKCPERVVTYEHKELPQATERQLHGQEEPTLLYNGRNFSTCQYVLELVLWFTYSLFRRMIIFFTLAQFMLAARYEAGSQQGPMVFASLYYGFAVLTILASIAANRSERVRTVSSIVRLIVDNISTIILVASSNRSAKAVVCIFQFLDIYAAMKERHILDKVLIIFQMLAKFGWIIALFQKNKGALNAMVIITLLISGVIITIKLVRRVLSIYRRPDMP